MDRCMKLFLQNTMYYERTDEKMNDFLNRLFKEDPGFETLSVYEFSFSDEGLKLANTENGMKFGPPSLEPQKDPCPGKSLKLAEGSYLFSQMPIPENEAEAKRLLMPFVRNAMKGKVFVRFYKENILECVMQFFLPL